MINKRKGQIFVPVGSNHEQCK